MHSIGSHLVNLQGISIITNVISIPDLILFQVDHYDPKPGGEVSIRSKKLNIINGFIPGNLLFHDIRQVQDHTIPDDIEV